MYKNNKFVIGSGFIGSYLINKGYKEYPRFDLEHYKKQDFDEGRTYIFTAGMSKPKECKEQPEKLLDIVKGTIESIKDISKKNHVIYLSSDAVLGKETPYAMSKKIIEAQIKNIQNVHIIRLSYVFSDIKGFEDSFYKYIKSVPRAQVYTEYKRNIIHLEDVYNGINTMVLKFSNSPKLMHLSGKDCISKTELVEYCGCFWDEIIDEHFFDDKDKVIEMKPNWYAPKIQFTIDI